MTSYACLNRVFLALGMALALFAVEAAPARADENAEARAYFEQGNRLLTQGLRSRGARRGRLLQQAFDAYVESLRIVRSRNVVFNAGITLEEMGRLDEAFTYFSEYLGYEDLGPEDRQEGTRRMTALRERVAVVSITSQPAGAEVRVDRRDLAAQGVTPLEIAVPAGDHRFFLSLRGYDEAELSVTAQVGQRAAHNAILMAQPVPIVIQAPATGSLSIDGHPVTPGARIEVAPGPHVVRFEPATVREIVVRPGEPMEIDMGIGEATANVGTLAVRTNVAATVAVDGTVMGEGSEVEVQLASGTRTVRVQAPGRAPAESQIDVRPGGRVTLQVDLRVREEGTTLGVLPVITWAVAGMASVAGTVLGIRALGVGSDYEDGPTEELLTDTERANTLADVAIFSAVGLGVVALVLTLVNGDVEQEPSTIRVAASPVTGGGLVMAELPLGAQ